MPYSALLGSTVDTCYCQSTVFVDSLVLSGTCYASVTAAVAAHLQRRRHPCRAAEAVLMVHPVQTSMEIPQFPVDKVVDVP